jgi:hypothetical protein
VASYDFNDLQDCQDYWRINHANPFNPVNRVQTINKAPMGINPMTLVTKLTKPNKNKPYCNSERTF